MGGLLFFRRPQPAEGQVYTSQVVRCPPQRGRSSGQALSLLPCLLLRPMAQDGVGGTQGQRLEGPGPQEGKQEPPPPPGLQEPQARPLLDQGGPRGFGSESSCPHSQVKPDLRTCPRVQHGVGPERWRPPESSWHHSCLSDSHVGTVPAEPAEPGRSPPGKPWGAHTHRRLDRHLQPKPQGTQPLLAVLICWPQAHTARPSCRD